jgi:hypothetical protein
LKDALDKEATLVGTLPLVFTSDHGAWGVAGPLTVAGNADGASPLAPLTFNFAALKNAIGSATSAPRSLTLMVTLDVAPVAANAMTWVSTCQ